MQQKIFTVTNPGGKFYGDTLRAAVSKTNLCSPEVFNHGKNGRTLNQSPALRFLATQSWVGALCDASRPELMNSAVPAITQVVASALEGETLRCQTFDTELSGSPSDIAVTYVARNIAIKRYFGAYKNEPWKATRQCRMDLDDSGLLEYAIKKRLKSAYQEGIISDLPPDDELELKMIDAKRSGVGNHFLVSGKFQMRLNLTGCWQAGNLQSKGYGLIGKVNRGGYTQWIL